MPLSRHPSSDGRSEHVRRVAASAVCGIKGQLRDHEERGSEHGKRTHLFGNRDVDGKPGRGDDRLQGLYPPLRHRLRRQAGDQGLRRSRIHGRRRLSQPGGHAAGRPIRLPHALVPASLHDQQSGGDGLRGYRGRGDADQSGRIRRVHERDAETPDYGYARKRFGEGGKPARKRRMPCASSPGPSISPSNTRRKSRRGDATPGRRQPRPGIPASPTRRGTKLRTNSGPVRRVHAHRVRTRPAERGSSH